MPKLGPDAYLPVSFPTLASVGYTACKHARFTGDAQREPSYCSDCGADGKTGQGGSMDFQREPLRFA